jgi:hypothetical protein
VLNFSHYSSQRFFQSLFGFTPQKNSKKAVSSKKQTTARGKKIKKIFHHHHGGLSVPEAEAD